MNSSNGGGFCDCGDVEAWKTGPTCIKHEHGASEDTKVRDLCNSILSLLIVPFLAMETR